MVRALLRILIWTAAVIVVLAVGLLLYLRNADLSVYREQIENLVAERSDYDLDVAGRFDLQVGGLTRVTAEAVTVIEQAQDTPEPLARVGHFTIVFDTWSLFADTFVVEELLVRDVSVYLTPGEEKSAAGDVDTDRLAVRRVEIEGFDLTWTDPDRPQPIRVVLESLMVTPGTDDILDLDLEGTINELPLVAEGKLGPWPNLVDGRDISADLQLVLGQLNLSVVGSAADVVKLDGISLAADVQGAEVARLIERLGLPPFAAGSFDLEARVEPRDDGHNVHAAGNLGEIEVFASGALDSLVQTERADLDFRVSGPDTRHVAELFGVVGVPAEPFSIAGGLALDGPLIAFQAVTASVGPNDIEADGAITIGRRSDNAVRFRAQGPDIAAFRELTGLEGLPERPFDITVSLRSDPRGLAVEETVGVLGENRLEVDGIVTDEPGLVGTALRLGGSGPELQQVAVLAGVPHLPAGPFDVEAQVEIDRELVRFRDARARVGELVASGSGQAGTGSRAGFFEVTASLQAPDAAQFVAVPYLRPFAGEALSFKGGLRKSDAKLEFSEVLVDIGDLHAEIDGVFSGEPNLVGTSLSIGASGPEFQQVAVLAGLPHLPAGPFDIEAQIDIDRELIQFRDARAQVGELAASGSGQAGTGSRAGFVEVTGSLQAPDAAQFVAVPYLRPFAGEALSFTGGLRKSDTELVLSEVLVDIGDLHAEVDGALSLKPGSNASDLKFLLRGPSLQKVGQMFDNDILLDRPFDASGQFTGTPSGFAMRDFVAHVGENDISGEFAADLSDKPRINGKLTSDYLDLRERLKSLIDKEGSAEETAEPEEDASDAGEFVFSDQSFDGHRLNLADIDIELQFARLRTNMLDVSDFRLGLRLEDGALRIDPISMTEREGSLAGKLNLVPVDGDYALDALLEASQLHLGIASTEDQGLATLPPVNGRIELQGVGNSLHEIMAAANGTVAVHQGAGEVEEFVAAILFRDVVLEALRTINPLRKESDSRRLDCGIYEFSIADGIATFDHVAMQTDQLLVVATGDIDLETEALNINFRAKPREGFGVSLGTLANSFLGVRGTLGSPAVVLDPAGSVTATGAAMATGGLSLLARGLWDRLSAEKSICELKPTRRADAPDQ